MEKLDDKLAKQIFSDLTHSFYANGTLSAEDLKLNLRDLGNKIIEILRKTELKLTVDYRQNIQEQGDEFAKNGQFEYAIVFYAMFFEHTLNNIIDHQCKKKGLDEPTKNAIIRNADFNGKLSWLPNLLGLKRLNEDYVKTMKKVAERRNAFVHYKWKSLGDDDITPDSNENKEFLKKIKAALKYIRFYESSLLYSNQKGNIVKVARKKRASK